MHEKFTPLPTLIRKQGFTLIELSIVLVIIGLVVGGIVVGKDMIENSQMRATITQIDQIRSAANTFKLKYAGLPGDIATATQFFGAHSSISGTPLCSWVTVPMATAWNAAPPEAGTCNGDGNGIYDTGGGNWKGGEQVVAWQQLSAAGLLSPQFRGGYQGGSGYTVLTPNVVAPGSILPIMAPTGYDSGLIFAINPPTSTNLYTPFSSTDIANFLSGEHVLVLGALNTANNYVTYGLLPRIAFAIDSKLDDGKPASGKIISSQPQCHAGTTNGDYSLTVTSLAHCNKMWVFIARLAVKKWCAISSEYISPRCV